MLFVDIDMPSEHVCQQNVFREVGVQLFGLLHAQHDLHTMCPGVSFSTGYKGLCKKASRYFQLQRLSADVNSTALHSQLTVYTVCIVLAWACISAVPHF